MVFSFFLENIVFFFFSRGEYLFVRFVRAHGVFEDLSVARRGGEEEVPVHDVQKVIAKHFELFSILAFVLIAANAHALWR